MDRKYDGSWIGNYAYSRARLNGDSIALQDLDTGAQYTYLDLDRRANALAHLLKDQFGVTKGDRVGLISRNRVEMIDCYYATGKLGAILVPYNDRLSPLEMSQLMDSEQPKVLIYEDLFAATVSALGDIGVQHYIVLGSQAANDHPAYDELLATSPTDAIACPELQLEDIHLIIHTGGTTGLPKGGLISHRSELFNSFNEICSWGLTSQDSAVIVLPLFHTGGWNLLTLPLLHVGGTIYLSRAFNPALVLQTVVTKHTTCLFGAATIFRMMVEHPNFADADLSSLRWVMAGAAPTPLTIMQAFWEKGVKFVLGYGMTEAGPNNISTPAHLVPQEVVEAKYQSVGKPMYLSLVKLLDDDDQEVKAPGVEGELVWSGPQIFSGYWDNPSETALTLTDGWVRTGDMAVFDEDGFYSIVGRKKNMYISGGENVFPPEIETALYAIDGVRECCVFGVPDEKWGEVGKAIISRMPGYSLTKADVLAGLQGHLARFKMPKYITFVDDVPKNSVGKIQVAQIVSLYGKSED